MFKKKEKVGLDVPKSASKQKLHQKPEADKSGKFKARASSRGNDDVFVNKPPEPKKKSVRKTIINNTIDVADKIPIQKVSKRKTSSTLVPKSVEKEHGSTDAGKKLSRAAVQIQKIWRGFWTRKQLLSQLKELY